MNINRKFEYITRKEIVPEYYEPSGWGGPSLRIYWFVHNNKVAGKKALEFFNKMTEDSIPEIASKLQVAEALLEHKFSEVIDFLLRIAQSKIDVINIVEDDIENEWSNLRNKIEAAVYLVRMDDERGKEILLNLEQNIKNEFISIVADLLIYSDNKMGVDLYLYFTDKYYFIEQKKERLYFENKINKNINRILNEYVHRGSFGFLFNIKKLAMDSKKELENLIELFLVMPESSADFIKEKVDVAKVLVEIGYTIETSFLIRVIDGTLDNVAKTQSNKNVMRMSKENASILLIELDNKNGKDFFRNLVKKESRDCRSLVVDDLLRYGTKNSIAFIVELSKEFPEVKEYCNRERIKKRINEVLGY